MKQDYLNQRADFCFKKDDHPIEYWTKLPYHRFIRKQIKTISEARAFIRYIVKIGKCWHFDDDLNPYELDFNGYECFFLEQRRNEFYNFKDDQWGKHGCPIGYALHCHKLNGDL